MQRNVTFFRPFILSGVSILFCAVILISCFMRADEALVNEILAIVYHKGGSVPITSSDLKSLDGRPVTLRDAILRQLVVIHGQSFTQVSDDDVERMLGELQKANGLSRDAMLHAFEAAGFTQEEGFAELKRQQIVSQVLEVRVRSDKRLIVQRGDVEAYDQEHPAFIESVYTLQQVCLPAKGDTKRQFSAAELDSFAWEKPFDVRESELPEERRFIIDAAVGTIVGRERVAEGLELTRLIKKTAGRRIPLNERYDEVMGLLHRERFGGVLSEFQQKLLRDASIWFSHPEDRDVVMGEQVDSEVHNEAKQVD